MLMCLGYVLFVIRLSSMSVMLLKVIFNMNVVMFLGMLMCLESCELNDYDVMVVVSVSMLIVLVWNFVL